jgi:protein-tyrosine phosphatase
MIDIHSHIIYGVDDGPSSIKESIRMVLEAEELGIREIVATPHFQGNLFDCEKALENFQELVMRTIDCGIKLHMGYEVFLDIEIAARIKAKEKITINDSKYLLFELPFDNVPHYSYEMLYKLHLEGIVPIIAHPERNRKFVRDFGSFAGLVEKGCLVQIDAASILGVYGSEIKSFAKKLITHNIVHFVASDAHCVNDYKDWYLAAYRKVIRWAGEEYARGLFSRNPQKVLYDLQDNICSII